jgi:multimeric flavodoxin WrbA
MVSSHTVCEETINSDLVLFASPIVMGFVGADLKKTMDKLIPLVHPYIELVQNECHHRKRYEKYPRIGLVLEKTDHADDEDIAITTAIFERFTLNLRSTLAFVTFTDKPAQEVTNEISAI